MTKYSYIFGTEKVKHVSPQIGRLVWEQELYDQITYFSPQVHFHTFPADVSKLSFSRPTINGVPLYDQ